MGKTLQTIALVWTLLSELGCIFPPLTQYSGISKEQNPYAKNPVIGKCLIACPVSLVNVRAQLLVNALNAL